MTTAPAAARTGWVRVWDPLTRIFHWILVIGVAITFLSQDTKAVHELAGYVVLGLVLFRLCWGVLGPRHARFSDFVASPRAVLDYLRDVVDFRARRYLGHNPAGGAMILALLVLLAVTAGSGWLSETDRFFGVGWVEDIHSGAANLLLVLVGLHVAGVVISSLLHSENLVMAMITGKKRE